ncbi:MAG: M14 family metallopeptidase [Pseudohongiellaceae bacterium]
MKQLLIALYIPLSLVLSLPSPLHAQPGDVFSQAMISAAELSNYERTSTFAEVLSVVDALQASSDRVHRETLLTSVEGRRVPLLVLADPPLTTPEQARDSGKLLVYIQGNIHGGEVEGKEAILIAMRDILHGDKQALLANQIILLLPVYNSDGNDQMTTDSRPSQEGSPLQAGQRTAHGYDLNRDGMIVDTIETAALYRNVIQRWDPDVFVDLHTTNGTWHGYSLTYAPSYHTAGQAGPSDYTSDVMLPAIRKSVKDKFDLEFNWYGGFDYRDWPPTELRTYHHAPRYLTNNMGLRNRMAILSETFAHDRFYKRVHAANVFVEEILEYTNTHAQEIREINRQADARVIEQIEHNAGTYQNGVRFEMVALDEPLDLLSYNYIPYLAEDGSQQFVRSSEIVEIKGVQNFNAFEPIQSATVPVAYVFPAQLESLATKLRQHGITVDNLQIDNEFEGQSFRVDGIEKQNFEQNNHRNTLVQGSFEPGRRHFSAGDYYVPMNNRLANLIFYLLEPQSDDGLAYWNMFDEVLQAELDESGSANYPVFKVLTR